MKTNKLLLILLFITFFSTFTSQAKAYVFLPWKNGTEKKAFRIDTSDITPIYNGTCSTHTKKVGKIDFNFSYNEEILSVYSGKVDHAEKSCTKCINGDTECLKCGDGYGKYVKIKHKEDGYSMSAHLISIPTIVKDGEPITTGQKIGNAGNTGNVSPFPDSQESTAGSHLHFEWRTCSSYDCRNNPAFYEATTQVHPNDAGRLVCGTYKSENTSCNPPKEGTWIIDSSCVFTGTDTAPARVSITNNATLTISKGAELNIDFKNHELFVSKGAKVLIEEGGKIF